MSDYNNYRADHESVGGLSDTGYDGGESYISSQRPESRASFRSDQSLDDAFYAEVGDENYYESETEDYDGGEAVQLGLSNETYDSEPEERRGSLPSFDSHQQGPASPEIYSPARHLANPLPSFVLSHESTTPRVVGETYDSEPELQYLPTSIMDSQHVGCGEASCSSPGGHDNSLTFITNEQETSAHVGHDFPTTSLSKVSVRRALARIRDRQPDFLTMNNLTTAKTSTAVEKFNITDDPSAVKDSTTATSSTAVMRYLQRHKGKYNPMVAAAIATLNKPRPVIERQYVKNPNSIENFAITSIHRALLEIDRSVAARVTEHHRQRSAPVFPRSIPRPLGRPGTALTTRPATAMIHGNSFRPRAQNIFNGLASHAPPKTLKSPKDPRATEVPKETEKKTTIKRIKEQLKNRLMGLPAEKKNKLLDMTEEEKNEIAKSLFRKFTTKFAMKFGKRKENKPLRPDEQSTYATPSPPPAARSGRSLTPSQRFPMITSSRTVRSPPAPFLAYNQGMILASPASTSGYPIPAVTPGLAAQSPNSQRLSSQRSFPPPGVTTTYSFHPSEQSGSPALARRASAAAAAAIRRQSLIQNERLGVPIRNYSPLRTASDLDRSPNLTRPGLSHPAVQVTPPTPVATALPFESLPDRESLPPRPRAPTPTSRRPE